MTQATNVSIIVWSKDGCSYCQEVKNYLTGEQLPFKVVDITNHEDYRDILEIKYGVRHVPVVEIGNGTTYEAVTKVGLEYVQQIVESQKILR